jgi:hypothetical protein
VLSFSHAATYHPPTHTHTHVRARTHTHIYIHARTHERTHTHTHTHTYTTHNTTQHNTTQHNTHHLGALRHIPKVTVSRTSCVSFSSLTFGLHLLCRPSQFRSIRRLAVMFYLSRETLVPTSSQRFSSSQTASHNERVVPSPSRLQRTPKHSSTLSRTPVTRAHALRPPLLRPAAVDLRLLRATGGKRR